MADWCNDCAWPEACAARMECERRRLGEVRAAAMPQAEQGFTGEAPGTVADCGAALIAARGVIARATVREVSVIDHTPPAEQRPRVIVVRDRRRPA